MKTKKILVSVDGAGLTMSSGAKALAVYPAGKGQDKSFLLMADGRLSNLRGARINGVGVARYFAEKGFTPAQPGNPLAEKLADMVDCCEGTALVEKCSQARAQELTRQFGGQQCTYVPFDEAEPAVPVTLEPYRGFATVSCDLEEAFSAGAVNVEYRPGDAAGRIDVKLNRGWLVGPEGAAGEMPRNTEYGGPVERAAFIICNSGMASLVGAKNLVEDENAPVDTAFPRGQLVLGLKNGDQLVVGIDGGDELLVQYKRDGAVVYSRSGLQGNGMNALRQGEIIGAIAAALVRVQEMDAEPAKGARARVKKAA